MSPQRIAFIDIGTNTILCLVAELENGGRFKVLADLGAITGLGQGVDQTGEISPEGEQRSLDVLRGYLEEYKNLGIEEIIAVGTSALRDAQNSREVIERWRDRLGLQVRVISGEEEAAYSFLAVQRGLSLVGRELLVIDVGGGSTEFIRGNESGMSDAVSVNIGSLRLTERFVHSDPVRAEECRAMAAAIDRELTLLRNRWLKGMQALSLVGIAGTLTTLAAVEKKLARYSHSDVHGSRLTLDEIRRQIRLFQEKTIAERKKIPGLEAKRADVILAGAFVVERTMTLLHAERITVGDQGVRYGLLHERLQRSQSC